MAVEAATVQSAGGLAMGDWVGTDTDAVGDLGSRPRPGMVYVLLDTESITVTPGCNVGQKVEFANVLSNSIDSTR
jgi:hypothetical protein